MGEDTLKREAEQRSWLKRHGIKTGAGGALMAVLGFLGNGVMEDVKDMSERLAVLETENKEIRTQQFESIWRTLYLMRDDLDEAKVDVAVVRELMACGIGPTGGPQNEMDMRVLMDALEALVADEEMDFEDHQVEEFRNMQQQYAPEGKK